MITAAHLGPTIPGWAPPAIQVSSNALADRRDQRVELFGRGGIDPMKSQLARALGRKDAINKQHVKMQRSIVYLSLAPNLCCGYW